MRPNMEILLTIICLLVPAGVLWLTHHQIWARRVGVIVLCYTAGLLVGNLGLVPAGMHGLQQGVTDFSIALALPLLLFTLDLRQWSRIAGKAMLSMLFATTSVVALATCLFLIFKDQGVETASHFAAMSVGVYTGGTPNVAAIKTGLDIPNSQYIVFHSLDTLLGAGYLLFMLTLGVPLFRRLLPPPSLPDEAEPGNAHHFDSEDYSELLQRASWPDMVKSLALSFVVVLLALGVAEILASLSGGERNSASVIVTLTTLGILLSLVPSVRRMHLAYKLGMYLVYVFCFVVASQADLGQLVAVDASVAVFLLVTIVGSLLLHCFLCRIAGVDSDTFMVTSVAAVASPPFVPMMARALGNPGVILSGMTTGIIGYALGNYLGISLALVLQGLYT